MQLRIIPSIEQLRQRDGVRSLESRYGRDAIVSALREEVDWLRARAASAGAGGAEAAAALPRDRDEALAWIERRVGDRLERSIAPSLHGVINATGVIVHTNLGRSPLPEAAIQAVARVAAGYSNLEYDLEAGRRGARDVHAERLLCRLTGAESAVVANNNAAATLVILAALAEGREVIVSRGELVEIGGGFRVPDVMAQSGARLREVGTTNKTRVADYEAAIGANTAVILRVHRSNFRIEGFTEQPSLADLVALGRRHGVPVVEDLGSGYLGVPGDPAAGAALDRVLGGEPKVQESIEAGADLVCFSGDKLLGGPQAGLIAGRAELVTRVRRHPLMRAIRADKVTYAAIEATLGEYVAGRAATSIPIVRMILAPVEQIRRRASRVARELAGESGLTLGLLDGASTVGGGAAPGLEIPTVLLSVASAGTTPDGLDARLRAGAPPVVARIEHDCLVVDLRTVLPEEDEALARAIVDAARKM